MKFDSYQAATFGTAPRPRGGRLSAALPAPSPPYVSSPGHPPPLPITTSPCLQGPGSSGPTGDHDLFVPMTVADGQSGRRPDLHLGRSRSTSPRPIAPARHLFDQRQCRQTLVRVSDFSIVAMPESDIRATPDRTVC